MDYTKLPLHNENYYNCNEKTKESGPVSSASPVRPVSINFAHVAMLSDSVSMSCIVLYLFSHLFGHCHV